jgi:flagellar motility protein MotE (MotC chaperone)
MVISETRREQYETDLARKKKDLANVNKDLAGPKTTQIEDELNVRAEQLLEEIEKLEKLLGHGNNDRQRDAYLDNNYWEQHLHKIDYAKANGLIESTLKKIDRRSRAALFLLEASTEFCGHYCIQHLRDRLEQQGVVDYPYTVDFQPSTPLAPDIFLHTFAEKLQVKLARSEAMTCNAVLDALCASVKGRNVLFLHINLELSECDPAFLEWIVTDFWCGLTNRLPQLSQYNHFIKLIGVISIDSTLDKTQVKQLCCEKSQLSPTKLLKLPSEKWSQDEIHRWLCAFSGLELAVARSESIAQNIFKQTKGVPDRTERRLLESLEKLAS